MGMNRKTGRGAKFLIVFVVIVIIMAKQLHFLQESMLIIC